LSGRPPIGAILAGGRSRRLGLDKARVRIGGVPLVERVAAALSRVVEEVVVIGKAGDEPPLAGRAFVADEHPERCALAGVVEALRYAGDRRVLVAACDHPFLSPGVLRLLPRGRTPADARVPEVEGRLARLVALYAAAACEPVLARNLETGRLALARAVGDLSVDVIREPQIRERDPELLSFVNVNDEASLRRARAIEEAVEKN
jgi:molybdopterin-guanine dinucleotide biosynthesis protein A